METQYAPKRPTINQKDLLGLLLTGTAILVGEYRGFKAEKIEYSDKTTGKPASFIKCEMNVERHNGEAVAVELRLPREVDNPLAIATGLTKGQQVALRLVSIQNQKGRTVATVGPEPENVAVLA